MTTVSPRGSLVVVTGPPGAGKSTVARLLADQAGPSALVEGDAFFAFLARDAVEPWLPEAREQNTVVTDAAGAATGCLVSGGFRTIYDGVVGPWFLTTFTASTGLAALDYVVLMPTIEACLERVMTRRGHGFRDEGAARKVYEEFSRADVDPRYVLNLGSESADEVATRVSAARRTGELRYSIDCGQGPQTPAWGVSKEWRYPVPETVPLRRW